VSVQSPSRLHFEPAKLLNLCLFADADSGSRFTP
jgi:hypothetical protein